MQSAYLSVIKHFMYYEIFSIYMGAMHGHNQRMRTEHDYNTNRLELSLIYRMKIF